MSLIIFEIENLNLASILFFGRMKKKLVQKLISKSIIISIPMLFHC